MSVKWLVNRQKIYLQQFLYHSTAIFKKMVLCRNWSIKQTFGLQSVCCLSVSPHGLNSLFRGDSTNTGNTRRKFLTSELHTFSSTLLCRLISKPDRDYQISLFPVLSGSVSPLGCFTPGGDDQRRTRSRCCLSEWYVSCRWKNYIVDYVSVYQTLTVHSLSGNSPRGAVPNAESLCLLVAKDRAADQWGGETGSFRASVPAATSPQDGDAVEGKQLWDTRQVRKSLNCCSDLSVLVTSMYVPILVSISVLRAYRFVYFCVRRSREHQACHQGDLCRLKWALEKWKKVFFSSLSVCTPSFYFIYFFPE